MAILAVLAGCTSVGSPPGPAPTGATAASPSTIGPSATGPSLATPAVTSPPPTEAQSGCIDHGADPDPACTPGSLNPAVTQATIDTTICVSGYTSRIRPPVAVTDRLKVIVAARYGYRGPLSAVEGDHYVPLEIGGNPEGDPARPDDTSNFWDEPHTLTGPDGQPAGSYVKDAYENWLREQVCSRRLSLAAAQHRILNGWYESYVADGRPG
jgi:hypothetical protein